MSNMPLVTGCSSTPTGPRVGQVVEATRRRAFLGQPRRVLRRARPEEVSERHRQAGAESDAHRFCKERPRPSAADEAGPHRPHPGAEGDVLLPARSESRCAIWCAI